MSAAEQVAEQVLEEVDELVDVIEIVKNNPVVIAAAGVTGLLVGAAGGYFIALQRLKKKFEEDLSSEIDQTREFYSRLHKVGDDGEPITPLDVLEDREGPAAAAAALRNYQGRTAEEKAAQEAADEEMDERQAVRIIERARLHSVSLDKEPGPHGGTIESIAEAVDAAKVEDEGRNVFEDATFDYDEEVKLRTPTAPYIITHDEFYENEPEHDQSRLTYYEKDHTLADENDKAMEDYNSLIGGDHLMRFGSGSRNEHVVYVRNEKVQLDWEITRSEGSYVDEVLNMLDSDEPDSLKHSNRNAQLRKRREFRSGER